jgi:hypothetical protein
MVWRRLITLFNDAVPTDKLKSVQRQDDMRNETDASVLGQIVTSDIKRTGNRHILCGQKKGNVHTSVGPKVSGLTYKSRAKWKMLRGIYSGIYGEVTVSVSGCVVMKGDCIEKWQSWFVSVTLKSWSGRKLLDRPSYNLT